MGLEGRWSEKAAMPTGGEREGSALWLCELTMDEALEMAGKVRSACLNSLSSSEGTLR